MPIKQDYAGILDGSIDYRNFLDKKNSIIIQIGAHDGIIGEEYGLQEILEELKDFELFLVEPIEKYFNNLINVYGKYKNKVKYLNYAIAKEENKLKMLDLGGESYISDVGNVIVNVKSWNNFIKENNIKKIDLLLLDCEGYEFEIIKQINFDNLEIKCIRYEYTWISNKNEVDDYLKSKNYNINYCYHDHTNNKIALYKK